MDALPHSIPQQAGSARPAAASPARLAARVAGGAGPDQAGGFGAALRRAEAAAAPAGGDAAPAKAAANPRADTAGAAPPRDASPDAILADQPAVPWNGLSPTPQPEAGPAEALPAAAPTPIAAPTAESEALPGPDGSTPPAVPPPAVPPPATPPPAHPHAGHPPAGRRTGAVRGDGSGAARHRWECRSRRPCPGYGHSAGPERQGRHHCCRRPLRRRGGAGWGGAGRRTLGGRHPGHRAAAGRCCRGGTPAWRTSCRRQRPARRSTARGGRRPGCFGWGRHRAGPCRAVSRGSGRSSPSPCGAGFRRGRGRSTRLDRSVVRRPGHHPPPPRQPAAAPFRQVAPIAIALAKGPGRSPRLTVALEPEELGRVEIRIERGKDTEAVTVHVLAERPETLALLQRDARALDRALHAAGIDVAAGGTSFGLGGQDRSAQDRSAQGQAGSRRQPAGDRAAEAPFTMTRPAGAGRSLFDIDV